MSKVNLELSEKNNKSPLRYQVVKHVLVKF